MAYFKIPKARINGFVQLGKLSESTLHSLKERIESGQLINETWESKPENIADKDLEEIQGVIFSIGELQQQKEEPIEQILPLIKLGLENEESITKALTQNQIDTIIKWLGEIYTPSSYLTVIYKAKKLLWENKNVFLGSRVITDIRTVFINELTVSQNAVIFHNLRISYSSDENESTFFVALDRSDLVSLKAQIERALEKESQLISAHSEKVVFINEKLKSY